MSGVWKTKYGLRQVRYDPPTLQEAIFAASGLTDKLQEQVEIAASLMGMSPDEVRPAVMKAGLQKKAMLAVSGRGGSQRAVIVERRTSRRPLAARSSGR